MTRNSFTRVSQEMDCDLSVDVSNHLIKTKQGTDLRFNPEGQLSEGADRKPERGSKGNAALICKLATKINDIEFVKMLLICNEMQSECSKLRSEEDL